MLCNIFCLAYICCALYCSIGAFYILQYVRIKMITIDMYVRYTMMRLKSIFFKITIGSCKFMQHMIFSCVVISIIFYGTTDSNGLSTSDFFFKTIC